MKRLFLTAVFASVLPGLAFAERAPRENFILRCAGCHGMSGEGLPSGEVPNLHGAITTFATDEVGRTYLMHVPGIVGASLSNKEIADVMNWVNEQWGNGPAPEFTEEEVIARRSESVPNVVSLRRELFEKFAAQGITIPDYPWP